VGEHQLEGVLAGLFAEARIQRNVAAHERLQAGADGAEDGARDSGWRPFSDSGRAPIRLRFYFAGRMHCSSQRPGTPAGVYAGSPPWQKPTSAAVVG
jgi:hypothetical protein